MRGFCLETESQKLKLKNQELNARETLLVLLAHARDVKSKKARGRSCSMTDFSVPVIGHLQLLGGMIERYLWYLELEIDAWPGIERLI